MHKTLVLAAILLCGCANPPLRQFNTAQADHVRQVMEQCAAIIAQLSFMLPPDQAN
jgi:outer membrane murein-binding lipoprotein Lpp